MSIPDTFKKSNLSLINDIKEQNIKWNKWKEEKISKIYDINKIIETYQHKTEQELEEEEIRFKHEIEQLEKSKINEYEDFKEFLDAIDKLKDNLKQCFNLPLALVIHRYAKKLLVSMWDSKDINERAKYEQQLFDLLYALNSDMDLVESEKENTINIDLPTNTLQLIRRSEDLKAKVNTKSHNYMQIARTIVGGASLGGILGTFFGFMGSVFGAGIGIAIMTFLLLTEESSAKNQNSSEESNGS